MDQRSEKLREECDAVVEADINQRNQDFVMVNGPVKQSYIKMHDLSMYLFVCFGSVTLFI